jgi:type IV secretion system protein VirB10
MSHRSSATLTATCLANERHLMEAGTQVIGNHVGRRRRQDRVVAVTASAVTPNGVVVQLGGPLADQLGAAGVPGSVDNHWWQRIGAAVVLSLVDNGFGLPRRAAKAGQPTSTSTPVVGLGRSASSCWPKTLNIRRRSPVNQGTRVALWVTKFIDFSDAYRLEPRR